MVTASPAPWTRRQATPERWQAALKRALAEKVTVRQLAGSGQWIATSGTDPNAAYELDVVSGAVRGCRCEAGQFDDPVCKHRAMWWFVVGALTVALEPDPAPAPVVAYDVLIDGRGYRTFATRAKAEEEVAKFSRWKSTSTRVTIVERAVPAAVALPPRVEPAAPAPLAA